MSPVFYIWSYFKLLHGIFSIIIYNVTSIIVALNQCSNIKGNQIDQKVKWKHESGYTS